VRTTPGGCDVSIDGNDAGTTDSGGTLTFGPVSAGKHVVTIRKDRYREERRDVTFASGADRSLEVTLTLLPAKLTVNANVPQAEIRIGKGEVHSNRVEAMELAPGRYEVTVAKLGFKTYSGFVDLEAGRSVRVDAALAPLALKGLVAEAEDEFVRERYDRVIALCGMVLADKPNRPRANLLLGASYLRAGRPADSVEPLFRALEGGERIAVPVRQRRSSLGAGETEGLLVIGRDVLAFLANGDPGLDFAMPLRGIVTFGRPRGANAPMLLTADLNSDARLPAGGLCLVPCGTRSNELPGRKGRGKKDTGEARPSRPRSIRQKDRGDDDVGGRRSTPEEIEYVAAPSAEAALDIAAQLYARLRR
jgi:hypothetical protein